MGGDGTDRTGAAHRTMSGRQRGHPAGFRIADGARARGAAGWRHGWPGSDGCRGGRRRRLRKWTARQARQASRDGRRKPPRTHPQPQRRIWLRLQTPPRRQARYPGRGQEVPWNPQPCRSDTGTVGRTAATMDPMLQAVPAVDASSPVPHRLPNRMEERT